jgi:hypothetical protein
MRNEKRVKTVAINGRTKHIILQQLLLFLSHIQSFVVKKQFPEKAKALAISADACGTLIGVNGTSTVSFCV